MSECIQVRGARVHNLKRVSLDLPLNALTVVTGVSGSGKSSLAFDTLYAEGQRRYVESLSAYARQFLERMEKPDADAIDGIAPAVAIRQKASSRNPRSTVATVTEIYDYLRLLYARAGETLCPDCGLVVERDDVDTAVARALAEAAGQRALVLFPALAPPAAPEAAAPPPALRLGELRGKGFNRLWQDGRTVEFSTPESLLELDLARPVMAVADRLVVEPEARARLADAFETAYREAGEAVLLLPDAPGGARRLRYHERRECKRCGRAFPAPEPQMFSFNHPQGACPRCQGFGSTADIAEERVVPDPSRSLRAGAIEVWDRPRWLKWRRALERFAQAAAIPLDRPWRDLTPAQRRRVWEGEGKFPGVRGFFERLERKKYRVHVRVLISRYRGYAPCPECGGARLRAEALQVKLRSSAVPAPLHIGEFAALPVAEALRFFDGLQFSPQAAAIAAGLEREVRQRLEFLRKVGLDYLGLDRRAGTLSGGEAQRIQLATCLGNQLVGALYVLDEPSIGLHPRDTRRLIAILRELRDLGNTLVVVEHDAEMMRASDHLVDLGPGAGELGGEIVAAGPWTAVRDDPRSLTGQYLGGARRIPVPAQRRDPGRRRLRIEAATAHNLRSLDVEIPLGLLVAVTGVSGSGKSTLVHEVLYRNLRRLLHAAPEGGAPAEANDAPPDDARAGCRSLHGAGDLSEVVLVDQSPIGRTPRSNPVTYIKAFDAIRELFAQQPEARQRGLRAGHFSFNVPGGRCETCQGDGVVSVDMQFLADVALVCEECNGARYQAGTLAVEALGLNVHQVLQLTVSEAIRHFAAYPKITRPLHILDEIGLGYLRLGQSATTLSGGEAQRIKLAAHLAQPRAAARTLFLFDEPTTGLHVDDIAKLLAAFERLLAAGASIVVIEHNLDVIKCADWILDLGPDAADAGGRLVAEGPPETVAQSPESRTAPFLAAALAAAP